MRTHIDDTKTKENENEREDKRKKKHAGMRQDREDKNE